MRIFKRFVLILLAILLLTIAYLGMRPIPAVLRLLEKAQLPADTFFHACGYQVWDDWLRYTDSYEILAARIPTEEWGLPDGWSAETVTIDQLETRFRIEAEEYSFQNVIKTPLPQSFDSWFFHEEGRGDPKSDWTFVLALHSEDGMIFIYSVYELWGSGYLET